MTESERRLAKIRQLEELQTLLRRMIRIGEEAAKQLRQSEDELSELTAVRWVVVSCSKPPHAFVVIIGVSFMVRRAFYDVGLRAEECSHDVLLYPRPEVSEIRMELELPRQAQGVYEGPGRITENPLLTFCAFGTPKAAAEHKKQKMREIFGAEDPPEPED